MTKEEIINRLNKIAEQSNTVNGEVYEVSVKDWEANGKSRTYLKISKKEGKKFNQIDCGYYDNVSGAYVKGYKDLAADRLYDYGGNHRIEL